MTEIFRHHDGLGLNDDIKVTKDDPGPGGASHYYKAEIEGAQVMSIQFQSGPRHEDGSTPGVTQRVLLAVVCDTLKSFQDGPYSCRENALAITKIEEAMLWLDSRARERARRGVLGFNKK